MTRFTTQGVFTLADQQKWVALVKEGLRFNNPKVRDLGPIRRAVRGLTGAVLPPDHQHSDSPFVALKRVAGKFNPSDPIARQVVIDNAFACLGALLRRIQDGDVTEAQRRALYDCRAMIVRDPAKVDEAFEKVGLTAKASGWTNRADIGG